MTLNDSTEYPAHTIAKYFEIHRAKKQILYLRVPNKVRTRIEDMELDYMKMTHAKPANKFAGAKKKSWEQMVKECNEKNFKDFYGRYGDMKELKIVDME